MRTNSRYKMNWFKFAVLAVIATVLQSGLVNIFAITDVKPNLLLILLVFFAIYSNHSEAIMTSFVIGFAADLIGPAMGPQMISFGICGTTIAYLHQFISLKKMPYQAIAIGITSILTGVLTFFLISIRSRSLTDNAYTIILGTSVYSSLIGPFLFLPCGWWMRIKQPRA